MRSAERHPGFGHAGAAGARHCQGDAEIGDQGLLVVEQDVLGLDIPVDDAVAMRVIQRRADFGGDAHGIRDGELLLSRQAIAERLALDERHDVVRRAVDLAGIDQPQDVGVLQVGDGLDLTQEPLGADDGRELGAQHLDGDLAVVLEVVGEVDGGHAALAELALDRVAVGQCDGQAVGS